MELVRRSLAAMVERDTDALFELAHPDIELDLTARVLNPDRYRGREGIQRFMSELDEIWEEVEFEPDEPVDAGGRVLVPLQVRLRGRGSGLPMEDRIFQVWSIRAGKVAAVRVFTDRDEARAFAGLEPGAA